MILILPQIQFEAIPSKDTGEVAFQSEADRSHKIFGLLPQNLFSCSSYGSDFEIFGLPVKRPFQKCILLSPPSQSSFLKLRPNI